ncbi:MAG: HAMP domain-containing protein [Candidatus Riflebacteria bacterium]|nr:HAMP domain-containing protein [Candidatus Riflebacteria bacterium]
MFRLPTLPPRSLQNALIFYITCILVFTNGFFAIITLSRENLEFARDGITRAEFMARLLEDGAREHNYSGAGPFTSDRLDRIWSLRGLGMQDLKASLYDNNWWVRWGDPARLPAEGFPKTLRPGEITIRSGVFGQSSREIFLGIGSGTEWNATLAVGAPEYASEKVLNSFQQVLLTTLINIFLGITLAIFIAQIILRPLASILEGLRAIRSGDFTQRIEVIGGGELRELGEMFNLMAASLQDKIREGRERNRILDEKVQELWEIYELTKAMGFSLHLAPILELFLDRAQTLSFSSYGQIILFQPDHGTYEIQTETPSFPRISRDVYENNIQSCIDNEAAHEVKTDLHTLLFIPLLAGRVAQGVLFLGKTGSQSFSGGIRHFLETIAPLGGSLIKNARLYQHVVEMKDYVRHVFDSVDSGVATLDAENRLVTVNRAFAHLLGLSEPGDVPPTLEEALVGQSFEVFRSGVLDFLRDASESLGNMDSPHPRREFVLPATLPATEFRTLQVRLTPLMAGDHALGRVLVVDDLTSVRQMERRLLETEKWVSLGRLAASVAHEIRNPLVAISSLVEIIGEDVTGENLKHIQVVLGEVKRLNGVVEQLLHLARPERTEPQQVSLLNLLDELLILVRHEGVRRKITIRKDWPEFGVCAKIDPEKIKQALLNIMLNGMQAMPNGGELSVAVRPGCGGINNGEMRGVEILVTDEGEGIHPDNLRRLFDPFFTTRVHGTGLGLAITKKIIDLHNGEIFVESKIGKGTTVRIRLPEAEVK